MFSGQLNGNTVLNSLYPVRGQPVSLYSPLDGQEIPSLCTVSFFYQGRSAEVYFEFKRENFPIASKVRLIYRAGSSSFNIPLYRDFQYQWGKIVSVGLMRSSISRSANIIDLNRFDQAFGQLGTNPSIESIDQTGPGCAQISFLDQSTCSNYGALLINTNTHTGDPTFGSPPYYTVQLQCSAIEGGVSHFYMSLPQNRAPPSSFCPGLGEDAVGNPFTNIPRVQYCQRMFPSFRFYKIKTSATRTNFDQSGVFGSNFISGLNNFPYMPIFWRLEIEETIDPFVGRSYRRGEVILNSETPIYFTVDPSLKNSNILIMARSSRLPDLLQPFEGGLLLE
jgi:hypothetical protein